jgi:hypothetical protein
VPVPERNAEIALIALEGLAGRADYSKDGSLSIAELDLWLSERVKELTARQQHPVARRPDTVARLPGRGSALRELPAIAEEPHLHFRHPEKPGTVTVPHPRKDITIGTLRP